MPEALTELERRILDYLVEYLRGNTYQPSIREIGKQFSIKSTKTVSELLQSLADKGWIERDPSRSRGVRLVGVDLKAETVTVPVYRDGEAVPVGGIALDRTLVGSAAAYVIGMPDEMLSGLGMHAGDLLLVEPVMENALAAGDVVYGTSLGAPVVRRLLQRPEGLALECVASSAQSVLPLSGVKVLGRVFALIRRIGVPRPVSSVGAAIPA